VSKIISILGSTGSIGTQSLSVCKNLGYYVNAITANSNTKLLEEQAREFNPRYVAITEEKHYNDLKLRLSDTNIKILCGIDGLCEIAQLKENDILINSVVGMIGLKPTLAAINAKKNIALANKETLVVGGSLVTQAAANNGIKLLPVDSEHSAIFQSLQGNNTERLNKIILTASGGPFYGKTREQLAEVAVADALKHPNWNMGAKITIDSATLMNKGLEFIEAMWLFNLKPEQIEVVVHRESIVHSAVEYIDGSVIAQLSNPDMRLPIQYALTYPDRLPLECKRLSLADCTSLTFSKPDINTFVCLKACIDAIKLGGLYPTIVNGANEQAVELFLAGKIKFLQIGEAVVSALENIKPAGELTLENIILYDKNSREYVKHMFYR